ncbi:MAG: hypothetical protein JW779_05760, partial [Candidatus Thorarchaeota archaeon]|nr:hypothetical protein [Candidatus Thorarchaeota archaeon]
STCEDNEVEIVINSTFNEIVPYWLLINFWPRLFVDVFGSTTTGAIYAISISTDILGDMQIHSLFISTEAEEGRTADQIEEDGYNIVDITLDFIGRYASIIVLGSVLGLLWKAIDSLSAIIVNLPTFLAVIGLMAYWLVAFVGFIFIIEWLVSPDGDGRDPWAGAGAMLGLMLAFFAGPLWAAITGLWAIAGWYEKWNPWGGFTQSKMWNFKWFIISFVTKIVVLVVCLHFFARYYAMGVNLRM